MKSTFLAVALVLAQAAQAPVFRSGVKLVTLDVTVVDGDGKPIAGLTPADFTASINGITARVETLDFQQFGLDRIGDARATVTAAPAGGARSAPARAGRGPQTFLLMFDDVSFVPGAGKILQFAVEKMLKQLDLSDLVGMMTTSGLEPPVSPTRDRTALFGAMKRLAGRQTENADPYYISAQEISEITAGLNDTLNKVVIPRECLGAEPGRPTTRAQTDAGSLCALRVAGHARRLVAAAQRQKTDQLNALRHAIEAMSRAPAPRVIVWLSAGISVDASPEVREGIEQLSALAARSGVQVYALFEEGDDLNMKDDSELRVRARRQESAFLLNGLQSAAGAAGGYAFRVIGQPDRFFSRIVSETSAVYRLGIELPARITDTANLRASVRVRRDGVHIRSTNRALAGEARATPLTREEAIKMALEHGSESAGVPIGISTRIRKDPAGGLQVMVDARIPADVPPPIGTAFGLVDAGGKMVLNTRRDLTPPSDTERQILFTMRAEAGDYRLRFVAADGTDRIGSTEIPVAVRFTRAGPFELSDLLTVFHDAAGTQKFSASAEIPASATQLSATVELYPDGSVTSGATTSVRMVLSQEGSAGPVLEAPAVLASSNDRWTATADLPLSALAAGRYTLRCDVTYGGAVAGSTRVSIVRK